MKRFKGFSLTEILTGMMLQAGFIVVLLTTFYMLMNFQSANTKLITAREKGQRVIAYIDSKIRNAGVGLKDCNIKTALLPLADTSDKPLHNVNSSVYTNSTHDELIILYPEESQDRIFFVKTEITPPDVISSDISSDDIVSGDTTYKYEFVDGSDEYAGSRFADALDSTDIRKWAVMEGYNRPFTVNYDYAADTLTLKLASGDNPPTPALGKLLYLNAARMFVKEDETDMNFVYENLPADEDNPATEWQDDNIKYYESGILAIDFDIDRHNKILNVQVLASGGYDPSLNTQRPASWTAEWKEEYKHHEVYVSRASWKLHNL